MIAGYSQQAGKALDWKELATRYLDAWNRKDVQAILKLTHSQVSYYDSFWGETCSGSDLSKYLEVDLAEDPYWYKVDGEIISAPNGVIVRYIAFGQRDVQGLEPVHTGAEIITISDGLIMTVSDYYCSSDPADLLELANLAEKQHGNTNVATLGLSARVAGRIKERLKTLADEATIFLDPALTVTQLAEHIGCSVMHLFHVLEEVKQTSFLQFTNESRVRYATTIIENTPRNEFNPDSIAKRSGFETTEAFAAAFTSTFSMSAEEYNAQFGQ